MEDPNCERMRVDMSISSCYPTNRPKNLHHPYIFNLRVYSPLCGLHGGMDHVVLEAGVLLILSPFKAGHLKNLFGERCIHSVALKIFLSLHPHSFSHNTLPYLEHFYNLFLGMIFNFSFDLSLSHM